MSRFSNPTEFLNHIKAAEARPFLGDVPDAEFQRISAEQLEEMHATLPDRDPYDWLVEQLAAEALQTLSLAQRAELQTHVAVGCLDHASFNAQIIRDSQTNHAIVLNKGLMLFLNKLLKIFAAAKNPADVIYCNRGAPSQFASEDYLQIVDDMMANFAVTGQPQGPRLKFRMSGESAMFVAVNLRWVELFIFCHEVGHYINGDLADSSKFVRWKLDRSFWIYKNFSYHQCEFAADRFAFRQLLTIAARDSRSLPSQALVGPLVLIFNILRGISNRDSYTHPAPSKRLIALLRAFFGEKAAAVAERNFADITTAPEIEAAIGNETVSQLLERTRAVL